MARHPILHPLLLAVCMLLFLACPNAADDDDGGEVDCGESGLGTDEDGDTFWTCGELVELIDCDDNDATVNPNATEICDDGADNDCNGITDDLDADEDGIIAEECGGEDCDDNNDQAYPGRPESCDGVDNDCDPYGIIDNGFDADDDGWTSCAGDCDNSDPFINPDAEELCDGIDNDCDCLDTPQDTNDDGTECGPGDADVDEAYDLDGDGFVDGDHQLCIDIYGPLADFAAWGDCNDDNATVFPGATEVSDDGVDNDCDSCLDECFDHDLDGWDNCNPGDAGDPTCYDPAQQGGDGDGRDADCNDSATDFYAIIVHPDFEHTDYLQDGTPVLLDEQCDNIDNDCDGITDEGYDDNCDPLEP